MVSPEPNPMDSTSAAFLSDQVEKGGYVAACAEVEIEPEGGRVRVIRVVEAFECGAVINPGQLENQIEGCIVQGLGGALFERIEFADSNSGKALGNLEFSYPEDITGRDADLPTLVAGQRVKMQDLHKAAYWLIDLACTEGQLFSQVIANR